MTQSSGASRRENADVCFPVIARSKRDEAIQNCRRGEISGLLRFARNDVERVATLSAVIAGEGGRSSIPETVVMETIGRGVLDRPVKPGDDVRRGFAV